MYDADAGLNQADDPADYQQQVHPSSWFGNVIEEIEQTEEELVPRAHHEQHSFGRVVDAEDGVS